MPISSSAVSVGKKKAFRIRGKTAAASVDIPNKDTAHKNFLTIGPALPSPNTNESPQRCLKRSSSTLSSSSSCVTLESGVCSADAAVVIQNSPDGTVYATRTQKSKEKNPDRICLDRRGLSVVPVLEGELELRLLSLQHNLISSLDGLQQKSFPYLVFLDVYDNQLENITYLDTVENLRVLLMGKNRLKRIEGLQRLLKLEVLDLHGNQINQVSGLSELSELKVLNLAGNQIRSIGLSDLQGLHSLQELNLRRNRIKKLLGFGDLLQLQKLFISNNEIQSVDCISSVAKCVNMREITIDNNPVSLGGESVSFLVSYLPQLSFLSGMQVTEQVRKAAMAWRRNKENSSAVFMDLASDVCLSVYREEIISNARTNWELIRCQAGCVTTSAAVAACKINSDFVLTPLSKPHAETAKRNPRMQRSSSQDTCSSAASSASGDLFRLPPILVPIITKMERDSALDVSAAAKRWGSLSSLGPNVDSSSFPSSSSSDAEYSCSNGSDCDNTAPPVSVPSPPPAVAKRNVKSAAAFNRCGVKPAGARASTAKPKRNDVPLHRNTKEREQGGDYLIEICGRFLNVYGHGALRFIDRPWNTVKALDVNSAKFSYVNYNSITCAFSKLKNRFPNVDSLIFCETNIHCIGQLNALAEIQGFSSLQINENGNAISSKQWRSYAVYRLSHWGLKVINGKEISEEEMKLANDEYQSLSDIALWSLPDLLLQPLLGRLRLDVKSPGNVSCAKRWLHTTDPELKSVVSKEALQWHTSFVSQEDMIWRQRARFRTGQVLHIICNTIEKLRMLDVEWPSVLRDVLKSILLDYSQLDEYMKRKLQQLN